MIIDCFTYMNERQLLAARIELLKGVVDRFVVVEGDRTFQGEPRALDFPEIVGSLALDRERIVYISVHDAPVAEGPWACERHQRDSILQGLTGLDPDALVLISDVDEIFRPEVLVELEQTLQEPVALQMKYLAYRANWMWDRSWRLPRAIRLKDLQSPDVLRRMQGLSTVKNAGWHVAWLGDIAGLQMKFRSFSHTELTDVGNAQHHLERCLRLGVDFAGRGVLRDVPDEECLPTMSRADFPDLFALRRSLLTRVRAHVYNFAVPGLRRLGFRAGPIAFTGGLLLAAPGRVRAAARWLATKAKKRLRRLWSKASSSFRVLGMMAKAREGDFT
jgi:beta-1,4-mannosyl-glycoprotein beta-1,4-N-acetylglucosaminyltransferase